MRRLELIYTWYLSPDKSINAVECLLLLNLCNKGNALGFEAVTKLLDIGIE